MYKKGAGTPGVGMMKRGEVERGEESRGEQRGQGMNEFSRESFRGRYTIQ
jgi:hypothetical protein